MLWQDKACPPGNTPDGMGCGGKGGYARQAFSAQAVVLFESPTGAA
jgi:hypothetical protein